jgi:hypothetical protein
VPAPLKHCVALDLLAAIAISILNTYTAHSLSAFCPTGNKRLRQVDRFHYHTVPDTQNGTDEHHTQNCEYFGFAEVRSSGETGQESNARFDATAVRLQHES